MSDDIRNPWGRPSPRHIAEGIEVRLRSDPLCSYANSGRIDNRVELIEEAIIKAIQEDRRSRANKQCN